MRKNRGFESKNATDCDTELCTYCLQPLFRESRGPGGLTAPTRAGPLLSTGHPEPCSNHYLPGTAANNGTSVLWVCAKHVPVTSAYSDSTLVLRTLSYDPVLCALLRCYKIFPPCATNIMKTTVFKRRKSPDICSQQPRFEAFKQFRLRCRCSITPQILQITKR